MECDRPPCSHSRKVKEEPAEISCDGLPDSVKNAPADLRAAIRKRQNSESARRSRERNRAEMEHMERKFEENKTRIKDLERTIDKLSSELMDTYHSNNIGKS